MSVPTVKLNSGYDIPVLGLGTWQSKPEEVTSAVTYALKETPAKHIDCAFGYGNEKDVGAGIAASGLPRSDIFITSKLWGTWHSRVEECLDQTLANLGTDYLDRTSRDSHKDELNLGYVVYLVHWPVPLNPNGNHPLIPTLPDGKRDVDHSWDIKDTWKQMEAMVKKGKVRSIGVSNFSQMNLEKLLATAEIVPAVDQLELHIYNPQHKLLKYLRSKGIQPQAYSPLGSTNSPLFKDETVGEIATKYSLQPADVLIGYLISKDIVTLPKSVTPSRIAANVSGALAAKSKLQPADIATLDGLAAAASRRDSSCLPGPWTSASRTGLITLKIKTRRDCKSEKKHVISRSKNRVPLENTL
ncbi:NADP-dependent oxidoreductase domain-containing protein [Mycena sp. CBHHK59/15]|nr:NADP-dependent oxidoreductase domain-containing protein [Mycena sp. CBHHK59/15]